MSTITTIGNLSNLLEASPETFSTAAANISMQFANSFVQTGNELINVYYTATPTSDSQLTTYLYGAQGSLSLLGSGFFGTSGTITNMHFTGDYGLEWNMAGAIRWNGASGITSIRISALDATYNGETLHMGGSLTGSSSGIGGKVTNLGIEINGISMDFTGSISPSSGSGSYKSLELSDASGSILIKGNYPVNGALDNELSAAPTFDELFNSTVLLAGNDVFNTPDAQRVWHGYGGNDTMTGGALSDQLYGDDGNDKLYGLGGNDTLNGGAGNNIIDGGEGDNTILAGNGNNKILSGSGADNITTGAGNDNIYAGDGNNTVDAGAGNNKITTGLGDDTIVAGAGNDNINAGEGSNLIAAGDGNNKVVSLSGNDTITSGLGNDNINAGAGDNQVNAGDGNNKIVTLSGNDILIAGNGNDTILAGDGDNVVNAGAGRDKIVTGSGNDILNGGDGADTLTGGAGSDQFVFDNLAVGGYDTVTDFLALEDMLVFNSSVFTSLADGITADNLVIASGAAAAAQDANDFLILNTQGGKLYYDADGNGAGAAVQIATLKGVTSLDISHLIVES